VLHLYHTKEKEMKIVKKFTHENSEIEIKEDIVIDVIDSLGGAAPWNIGKKIQSKKYHWFINGQYVESLSWSNKKAMQNILINQFIRTNF
jgi:hypothetical protein